MMKITATKTYKILAILLCFLLCFEQSGFAQVAGQLDISGYLTQLRQSWSTDKFRPLHLRYLSYDNLNNTFKLLLDKGDQKTGSVGTGLKPVPTINGDNVSIGTEHRSVPNIETETKTLLNYFFIGVSLPNDTFWVNLRPDSPDNMIDPLLATTDVGKILLEADVQLKKDTAKFTSPDTPEGREYWDKLYLKAGEIFGSENITIPTLTRPWIVPDEIIIRESDSNAYIYKATLKVLLEEDYLNNNAKQNASAGTGFKPVPATIYKFDDPRLKELNVYSSQLIRELIIPKLTKEINISKRYAPLRQVYYSLIMAQWFKLKFYGKGGKYSSLIDGRNLDGLTSNTSWDKDAYFQAYKESFEKGEYNIKEPVYTLYGQTIRSYFSGGLALNAVGLDQAVAIPGKTAGRVMVTHTDRPASVTEHLQAVKCDADGKVSMTSGQALAGATAVISDREGKAQEIQEMLVRRGFNDPQTFRDAIEAHELSADGFALAINAGVAPNELKPMCVIFAASFNLGKLALEKFKKGEGIQDIHDQFGRALSEISGDDSASIKFGRENAIFVPARLKILNSSSFVEEGIKEGVIRTLPSLSLLAREILTSYGIDVNDPYIYLIPARKGASDNVMHNRSMAYKFGKGRQSRAFVFKGGGLADKREINKGNGGLTLLFAKARPPYEFRGGVLEDEYMAYAGAAGWLREKFSEYYHSGDPIFEELKKEGLTEEAQDMFIQPGAAFQPLLLPAYAPAKLSGLSREEQRAYDSGLPIGLYAPGRFLDSAQLLTAAGFDKRIVDAQRIYFYQTGAVERIEELATVTNENGSAILSYEKGKYYLWTQFFQRLNLDERNPAHRALLLKQMTLRSLAVLRILWNEGYAANTAYGSIVNLANCNPLYIFDYDTIGKGTKEARAADIATFLQGLGITAYVWDLRSRRPDKFSAWTYWTIPNETEAERLAVDILRRMNPEAFGAFLNNQEGNGGAFALPYDVIKGFIGHAPAPEDAVRAAGLIGYPGVNAGTINIPADGADADNAKVEEVAGADNAEIAHAEDMKPQDRYYSRRSMRWGQEVVIKSPLDALRFGRQVGGKQIAVTFKGAPVLVQGKPLEAIVERGIGLSGDEIGQLIHKALDLCGGADLAKWPTTPNGNPVLVIGLLDSSPRMFEDHVRNGFIGVNASVNRVTNPEVKKFLLRVGVFHEMCHELTGRNDRTFEREQMQRDAQFAAEIINQEHLDWEAAKEILSAIIAGSKFVNAVSELVTAEGKKRTIETAPAAAQVEAVAPAAITVSSGQAMPVPEPQAIPKNRSPQRPRAETIGNVAGYLISAALLFFAIIGIYKLRSFLIEEEKKIKSEKANATSVARSTQEGPGIVTEIDIPSDWDSGSMTEEKNAGKGDGAPLTAPANSIESVVARVEGKIYGRPFKEIYLNFHEDGTISAPERVVYKGRGNVLGKTRMYYRVQGAGVTRITPEHWERGVVTRAVGRPLDANGNLISGREIPCQVIDGNYVQFEHNGRIQVEVETTNYEKLDLEYERAPLPEIEKRDFPPSFANEIIKQIGSMLTGRQAEEFMAMAGREDISLREKMDFIENSGSIPKEVKAQAVVNTMFKFGVYDTEGQAEVKHNGQSWGSTLQALIDSKKPVSWICGNTSRVAAYLWQRVGLSAGYSSLRTELVSRPGSEGEVYLVEGGIPHAKPFLEIYSWGQPESTGFVETANDRTPTGGNKTVFRARGVSFEPSIFEDLAPTNLDGGPIKGAPDAQTAVDINEIIRIAEISDARMKKYRLTILGENWEKAGINQRAEIVEGIKNIIMGEGVDPRTVKGLVGVLKYIDSAAAIKILSSPGLYDSAFAAGCAEVFDKTMHSKYSNELKQFAQYAVPRLEEILRAESKGNISNAAAALSRVPPEYIRRQTVDALEQVFSRHWENPLQVYDRVAEALTMIGIHSSQGHSAVDAIVRTIISSNVDASYSVCDEHGLYFLTVNSSVKLFSVADVKNLEAAVRDNNSHAVWALDQLSEHRRDLMSSSTIKALLSYRHDSRRYPEADRSVLFLAKLIRLKPLLCSTTAKKYLFKQAEKAGRFEAGSDAIHNFELLTAIASARPDLIMADTVRGAGKFTLSVLDKGADKEIINQSVSYMFEFLDEVIIKRPKYLGEESRELIREAQILVNQKEKSVDILLEDRTMRIIELILPRIKEKRPDLFSTEQTIPNAGADNFVAPAGGVKDAQLGAQVANMARLDRLLRILNQVRQRRELAQLSSSSSDVDIIEACIHELDRLGLIEPSMTDSEGNQIVAIREDKFGFSDNTVKRLIDIVREYVIIREGGAKAVNFQGSDKKWVILGFEQELKNPGTLYHEQREIFHRKQGFSWIDAHNKALEDAVKEQMMTLEEAQQQHINKDQAQKHRAGQQDKVGADVGVGRIDTDKEHRVPGLFSVMIHRKVAKDVWQELAYVDHLKAVLRDISGWNGTPEFIRNLAAVEMDRLNAIAKGLAIARSVEDSGYAFILEQLYLSTEHAAMFLHANSWLSPTYPGSSYTASGLLQNYHQNRGSYEREKLVSNEAEKLFGEIYGTKNTLLFRNADFAFSTLVLLLLSKYADVKGDILVSEHFGEDKRDLIEALAARRNKKVVYVDFSQDLGDREMQQNLYIFTNGDIASCNAIGRSARTSQSLALFYDTQGFSLSKLGFGDILYSIHELKPMLEGLVVDTVAPCVVGVPDGNLAAWLAKAREFGGNIDAYLLWELGFLLGFYPRQEKMPNGQENSFSENTYGDTRATIAALIKKYDALLEEVADLDLPEEAREYHTDCVLTLLDNSSVLEKWRDAPPEPSADLSRQLYEMEAAYRAILKMSAYFKILGMTPQERITESIRTQGALERQFLSLYEPVMDEASRPRPMETILTQSGMVSFKTILHAVLARTGNRGVLLANSTYYELANLIGGEAPLVDSIDEHDIDGIKKAVSSGKHGIIFMEAIANALKGPQRTALSDDYSATDMRRLVSELCALKYDAPFYCVIDASVLGTELNMAAFLNGRNIPDNLHFILVNSLQKFHEEGLELSTGGAITVISANKEEQVKTVAALRQAQEQVGSALGLKGLLLLDSLGFDKASLKTRTIKINANALELATYLDGLSGGVAAADIRVIYPGLAAHPDHTVAQSNYDVFGPFLFLKCKDTGLLIDLLSREMKKRGIMFFARDSFGYDNISYVTYYGGHAIRISLGTEDQVQMAQIKEAFKAAWYWYSRPAENIEIIDVPGFASPAYTVNKATGEKVEFPGNAAAPKSLGAVNKDTRHAIGLLRIGEFSEARVMFKGCAEDYRDIVRWYANNPEAANRDAIRSAAEKNLESIGKLMEFISQEEKGYGRAAEGAKEPSGPGAAADQKTSPVSWSRAGNLPVALKGAPNGIYLGDEKSDQFVLGDNGIKARSELAGQIGNIQSGQSVTTVISGRTFSFNRMVTVGKVSFLVEQSISGSALGALLNEALIGLPMDGLDNLPYLVLPANHIVDQNQDRLAGDCVKNGVIFLHRNLGDRIEALNKVDPNKQNPVFSRTLLRVLLAHELRHEATGKGHEAEDEFLNQDVTFIMNTLKDIDLMDQFMDVLDTAGLITQDFVIAINNIFMEFNYSRNNRHRIWESQRRSRAGQESAKPETPLDKVKKMIADGRIRCGLHELFDQWLQETVGMPKKTGLSSGGFFTDFASMRGRRGRGGDVKFMGKPLSCVEIMEENQQELEEIPENAIFLVETENEFLIVVRRHTDEAFQTTYEEAKGLEHERSDIMWAVYEFLGMEYVAGSSYAWWYLEREFPNEAKYLRQHWAVPITAQEEDMQKLYDFISSHGEKAYMLPNGSCYSPSPVHILMRALTKLQEKVGPLRGKRVLDIGAGKNLGVSLVAEKCFGMKPDAAENDQEIFKAAQATYNEAVSSRLIQGGDINLMPGPQGRGQDVLEAAWDGYDAAVFYFTQPGDEEQARMFRQRLQAKALTMKPGSILAFVYIENLFRPETTNFPDMDIIYMEENIPAMSDPQIKFNLIFYQVPEKSSELNAAPSITSSLSVDAIAEILSRRRPNDPAPLPKARFLAQHNPLTEAEALAAYDRMMGSQADEIITPGRERRLALVPPSLPLPTQFDAVKIRQGLQEHWLDLRRGEYATKPMNPEEIDANAHLDLTFGRESVILNGAVMPVHVHKDGHFWIEGGGMPEWLLGRARQAQQERERQAQSPSEPGAAGEELAMIDGGAFTRAKKGSRGFSLIELPAFSVVPGTKAPVPSDKDVIFEKNIERGERHVIIKDNTPFGMGLYPCTGVIVYNTRTHKTYAVHSERSTGSNIIQMFKAIKKDGSMMSNPDEISVIAAGAMVTPLNDLFTPAETRRAAVDTLQQRKDIMALIREYGFKNVYPIFSGQVGIGVDLYFDPGVGVVYPKLNIDENLGALTRIDDFVKSLPDADEISPEMERLGGFAAWGWGKDKGEQAGNAQPQSGPGAAGEVRAEERAWKTELSDKLREQNNKQAEIDKAIRLIEAGQRGEKEVILEIGCGNTEVALEIARNNPDLVVIASDIFDLKAKWPRYQEWADDFEKGLHMGQQRKLPNLAVIRSAADILRALPDNALDYVLIVNPEEGVVKNIFSDPELLRTKVKKGIVIKPVGSFENLSAAEIGPALDFIKVGSQMWKVNINDVSSFSSSDNRDVWIGLWGKKGSSPLQQKDKNLGGIDFGGAMPIMTQPIPGQHAMLPGIQPFSSPAFQPKANPELVKKWQEILKLLRADIPPSPERLREYLQDCYANGCIDREIDKVLGCIADILRKEEERGCLTEASLKEILVALEQESSAVNLAAALNKISVSPGEPQLIPGS